jgi:hypothetical protein
MTMCGIASIPFVMSGCASPFRPAVWEWTSYSIPLDLSDSPSTAHIAEKESLKVPHEKIVDPFLTDPDFCL